MQFALLPALAAEDLLTEVELDNPEVHVHAQAVYRLRLLHAVDVRDVQFHAPSARLADLRKIGEDRIYETQRDGRRYRVREHRYAVFPFASGALELAGAHVTGRVPAATADGWRPVRFDAPARSLTVLPVDIHADGAPWLPAGTLALTEQWTTAENGVHRRTLRIEATGVDAIQLPELEVHVEGMDVFSGPPRLRNHFVGERNLAVREQTYVIMPRRSGLFTVPPLELQWWNVDSNTAATAALPGRTLLVGEPAANAAPGTSGTALKQAALWHLWTMLAVASVAALLFAGLRSKRLHHAWRLRQASRSADPRAVRDALLAWAEATLPDAPRTLAGLAERAHAPSVRNDLFALERSLYGPESKNWNAGALAALVAAVRRDARSKRS